MVRYQVALYVTVEVLAASEQAAYEQADDFRGALEDADSFALDRCFRQEVEQVRAAFQGVRRLCTVVGPSRKS